MTLTDGENKCIFLEERDLIKTGFIEEGGMWMSLTCH